MSVNYRLVHAPAERVFEVLGDGWTYCSWVVGTSRLRAVNQRWPQPGAKLHHSFGLWPLVIDDQTTVVDWQPPTRAVFRASGGPLGAARVTFELLSHPRGCVVRLEEDAVQGPALLVPRSARDLFGRMRNRETLRRLAYLAERRTDDN